MCLAIYKPADTLPDWEAYANGFRKNDDSWGFAAIKDGALAIERGLHSFGEFRHAFEPYADCQAIIHFRYATHGEVDVDNAHPFLVSEDLAVIHNGMIEIDCSDKTKSDTWHYVEGVLKPLHEGDATFYRQPHIMRAMGQSLAGNKLIFLHSSGDVAIWNEKHGVQEVDGHWYSNTGYKWYSAIGYGAWHDTTATRSKLWSHPCDAPSLTYDDHLAELADDPVVVEEDEGVDECDAYSHLRIQDLQMYGFSQQCLDEVFQLLGHEGIEALHDAL